MSSKTRSSGRTSAQILGLEQAHELTLAPQYLAHDIEIDLAPRTPVPPTPAPPKILVLRPIFARPASHAAPVPPLPPPEVSEEELTALYACLTDR